MRFELRHKLRPAVPIQFTDSDAPDWLTGVNSVPGSTMDHRWFWKDHVMTLKVGEFTSTDFHTITRIE